MGFVYMAWSFPRTVLWVYEMKVTFPKSKWGQALLFFCSQFISFFLIVANTRAFTQGSYGWTALTDTLFSMEAAIMGRLAVREKEATGFWASVGYIVGGTVGSLFSIYITKKLYGR